MEHIKIYIEYIAVMMEAIGVAAILIGSIYAISRHIFNFKNKTANAFTQLRQEIGKSILLGLEILIAADIIATVVTQPTLRSVTILAIVVVIRTFLSLSLQVELDGKFPWQKEKSFNDQQEEL